MKIEWHAAGTVGPTSHSNSMKGDDSMNINTGELRAISDKFELEELKKEWGDSLREVPPDMLEEVNKVHDGKVDLDSDSPLANFAREEREKRDKGEKATTHLSNLIGAAT